MVATEFLEVGLNTVNKAAMNKGLSDFVLAFSGTFSVDFEIEIKERWRWGDDEKLLINMGFSYGGQICTYIGIGYGSPTLASAMADLTPAFTFIFSIISRCALISVYFHCLFNLLWSMADDSFRFFDISPSFS
ncbi:hypothetical protein Gotur_034476 [Gossypium turneri]